MARGLPLALNRISTYQLYAKIDALQGFLRPYLGEQTTSAAAAAPEGV